MVVQHAEGENWVAFEGLRASSEAMEVVAEPRFGRSARVRPTAGGSQRSKHSSGQSSNQNRDGSEPPLLSLLPSPPVHRNTANNRGDKKERGPDASSSLSAHHPPRIVSTNTSKARNSSSNMRASSRDRRASSRELMTEPPVLAAPRLEARVPKASRQARSISRGSFEVPVEFAPKPMPKPVVIRSRTDSTASISGSDEDVSGESLTQRNPRHKTEHNATRGSEVAAEPSAHRGRSRGRAHQAPVPSAPVKKEQPRKARSENRPLPKNVPPPRRGRSSSRTRSSAPQRGRGRSNSRSRANANRPPQVSNNRHKTRSRSQSLTRITGPVAAAPSPGSMRNALPKNPAMSRAHKDKKRGDAGSVKSSRSVKSANDANIGKDISFGWTTQGYKNSVKPPAQQKSGFMGRLFGHQAKKSTDSTRGTLGAAIRPRTLLAATVYHNTATNLWITTINTNQRGVAKNPALANKYLKAFSFQTEKEARESAIANAPPKMVPFRTSPQCFACDSKFAVFRRAAHCRNCGVCICNNCSTTWPAKMIPGTYNLKKEATVKICAGCDSLSSAFKRALLDGDYEDAVAIYGTGNVNLRTPFRVTNKKDEVMYPIHCAVEGGNLDVLRWLIDDHFCPIKLVRTGRGKKMDTLILTSKGRSVLSIALEFLKVDVMRYLVVECGVSIYESTDLKLSLRALEAALTSLPRAAQRRTCMDESFSSARWDKASFDELSEPSSLGYDENFEVETIKSNRTKGTMSDSCIICFDRKINCVATPCGHQICCVECSANLSACPVCNNRGDFIKIFRP